MRPLRLTPWAGSPGVVETVTLGPPVGGMAAVSGAAGFNGGGTVAAGSTITGALGAAAQASSFAGAGSLGLNGALGAQAPAAGFAAAATVAALIEDPLAIATYGTAVLKRWHRGDQPGTLAAGKVASWTNLADGGANPGIGTSPRQPTWLADAGNGLPAVQGLGDNEAGTTNRDELRWPGYARPAPGTTPNFQIIVWRKDGNELGTNRMLVADSAASAFQLKRPSASALADMCVVNVSSNELNNTAYAQDTVICTEWLLANSLESYHKVQGVVSAGSFGGNNAGTAASMFVTQAGTAWMAATVFELIEFWGKPTVIQLAKLHAYLTDRYAGLVV